MIKKSDPIYGLIAGMILGLVFMTICWYLQSHTR